MTLIYRLLNRDVRGRRVQVIAYLHPQAWQRRGLVGIRGTWPKSGPWPIFRYWRVWILDVRVWTARAQQEQATHEARRVVLNTVLRNVEQAARELDELFDGEPGNWKLGGRKVTEHTAERLLSLHDYLNDAEIARTSDDWRRLA